MTNSYSPTITRRRFTSAAAVVGGALALPACGRSSIDEPVIARDIHTVVEKPDWAIGFQNAIAHEFRTDQVKLLSGKVPLDLNGTFYRNGPALFERNGVQMNHWFDGDGMLQAFAIEAGKVSHTGSMVKTKRYLNDSKAGRFTTNSFATNVPDPAPVMGPDDMNVSNTSVMNVNGELYALWEGGSAFQVEPDTLKPIGNKTWGDGLKGMPFSAHPRFEVDGSLWNFGQDYFSKRLIIYRIDANGKLVNVALIPDVPAGMIHDFCITEKHLIFVVPSFRVNKRASTVIDSFSWMADQAQNVIVIEKNDLSKRRQFELPPGFQFHFGNAYEEKGTIIYNACVGNEKFATQGARDVLKGDLPARPGAKLATVELSQNGSAKIRSIVSDLAEHEFPQFNPLYQGKKAQYLYTVGKSSEDRPGESAIVKHDLDKGDLDFYDYGNQQMVEEHLFIPKSSQKSEDDGYLIGTTLNLASKRSHLNILDAQKVNSGPIAVLELPYHLPLGFHGTWMNKA